MVVDYKILHPGCRDLDGKVMVVPLVLVIVVATMVESWFGKVGDYCWR